MFDSVRRNRVLVALAVSVLVPVAFAAYQRAALGAVPVLYVWENSTRSLAEIVGWDERPPLFDLDQAAGRLWVGDRTKLPSRPVKLLVLYEVSGNMSRLEQRIITVRKLPFTLPLTAPIELIGSSEEGGAAKNVVDNTKRLLLGDLVVESVDSRGVITLRYGPDTLTLTDVDDYTEALVERPDGQLERVLNGPDYINRVEAAFAEEWPITRLVISNAGPWRRSVGGMVFAGARGE